MKPPGKIKKAPNFVRLLRDSPEQFAIIYRNTSWRWKTCGGCGRQFWKNSDRRFNANPIKSVYCSKPCQIEGQRLRTLARKKRYERRLALGLVNHRGVQARRGKIGGSNGKGISRRPKVPLSAETRSRIGRLGAAGRIAARRRQRSGA